MIAFIDTTNATRDEVVQSYLDHGFTREEAEVSTGIVLGEPDVNVANVD